MAKDTRKFYKTGFSKDDLITVDDETLHRMQKTLLGIFHDFADAAGKYDIHYSMGGGSALGAVRHHGFIPWDDDIDINIPRKDYNRLLEIFDTELGDRYELCAPERGHDFGLSCAQIKKKGTLYRSFNELSAENPGICIDLFVIENVYDNPLKRRLHGILCLGYGYMLTCRKTCHEMPCLKKYLKGNDSLRAAFRKKAVIGSFFRFISLDHAARVTARVYSRCKNNESAFVTVPSGRKHYFGEMHLRSDLCETVLMPFEDMTVPVSKNFDRYLTDLYGADYMQIPAEGKHEQHPIMELDFGKAEN